MRINIQYSPCLWWQKLHDFHVHLTRIHAVHLVDLVPEFLGADRRHGFEDIHLCTAGTNPFASWRNTSSTENHRLSKFPLDPRHEEIDDALLPFGGDGDPARHLPPLGETVATTTGAGVLRDENWMSAHRSLFPVIRRVGGRQARANEILAMPPYRFHAFAFNVGAVRFRKVEPATEL